MDQITNWMLNNWYELGTLVAQFAFLFAGLWFAVKILRTMRATQEQMGALLRLSMGGSLEERSKISETAHETVYEAVHEPTPSVVPSPMLTPAPELQRSYSVFEKPAPTEMPAPSNELSGRAKASAPMATAPIAEAPVMSTEEPTPYVEAPLTLPEGEHDGGHIATAVQWLQTPMTHKKKSASPLKKVVRWLQAPAR